jgi:hypothetical protein
MSITLADAIGGLIKDRNIAPRKPHRRADSSEMSQYHYEIDGLITRSLFGVAVRSLANNHAYIFIAGGLSEFFNSFYDLTENQPSDFMREDLAGLKLGIIKDDDLLEAERDNLSGYQRQIAAHRDIAGVLEMIGGPHS